MTPRVAITQALFSVRASNGNATVSLEVLDESK
jgi:hypothetical protein